MSRIMACFDRLKQQHRKALIPFITAGDPQADLTVDLMHALVRAGANIIELGVPFSDPMADGPVIQRASERALDNHVSLTTVLQMVTLFRQQDANTPVVLMGYVNPIEAMGYDTFAKAAQAAGVDGVLTVDLPPEEGAEFNQLLKAQGLDSIFLIAPTTTEPRIQTICQQAGGFIYYVSLKGVTGSQALDVDAVADKLTTVRAHTDLPIGVGFGIRDAASAAAVAQVADAVVVGSTLVSLSETVPPQQLAAALETLLGGMRQAMDMTK